MKNDASRVSPPLSPDARGHRQAWNFAPAWVAPCAHALLLAGAAVAVFLAAGVPQGSAGIFLVCAGAALVLCPPGAKVAGWLWLGAGALIVCASLAFLPAHWFPVPAWRKALESIPIIPLPTTITPVPWQSAFWLALLAATALSGLFLLAQPLRSGALLRLALAAALICAAYSALAIYAKTTGWRYPFDGGATFGFFPNRNHTATFLVTGSILGLGLLRVTLHHGRYLAGSVAAGCLTVCVSGLFFYSSSRGGIVFLLLGTLIWIGGLGRRHRNTPLLVSAGALVIAAGVLFAISGSEVRNRLLATFQPGHPAETQSVVLETTGNRAAGGPLPAGEDTPFDFRVLIYRDTIALIRDFPVTGTGLGAFSMVFPQYRQASLSESPALHPESDWLMLVAEAGIPALVCLVALLWLLCRRLPPLAAHPYWPLRWGCVVAALAALLHGLVDVPAHHLSLGWWMLAVAGLGFQPGQTTTSHRSRAQHAVFVFGGIATLILGVALIRAEWFGAAPLPPYATDRLQTEIARAYAHQDIEGAGRLARQAIVASPLAETFYYEWGALELPFADSDAQVDAAFASERLLNPSAPIVPLRQGDDWLPYDSARASSLWLEALRRHQRLDRVGRAGGESSVDFYRELLFRGAKWPVVQQNLLAAGEGRPEFVLAWLETAQPVLVHDQLELCSSDDAFLRQLNPAERRRFLLAWYAAGDRGKLNQFIDNQPAWQTAAWPVRLRQWIDEQDYKRAVEEAAAHYQISLTLPAPAPEGSLPAALSAEPADPVAAFKAYWRSGNTVAAERVLEEAKVTGAQPTSAEILRLRASIAAQKPDWPTAWRNLQRCIQAGQGNVIP